MQTDDTDLAFELFELPAATERRLAAAKPSTRRTGPLSTGRDDAAIAEPDNQRARQGRKGQR